MIALQSPWRQNTVCHVQFFFLFVFINESFKIWQNLSHLLLIYLAILIKFFNFLKKLRSCSMQVCPSENLSNLIYGHFVNLSFISQNYFLWFSIWKYLKCWNFCKRKMQLRLRRGHCSTSKRFWFSESSL